MIDFYNSKSMYKNKSKHKIYLKIRKKQINCQIVDIASVMKLDS